MKKITIQILIIFFIAVNFAHAVRIESIPKVNSDGSENLEYVRLIRKLPPEDKDALLVVSINGMPFGEFASGGVLPYFHTPASAYKNQAISKIAKTLVDRGFNFPEAVLKTISRVNEQELKKRIEDYQTALMVAYEEQRQLKESVLAKRTGKEMSDMVNANKSAKKGKKSTRAKMENTQTNYDEAWQAHERGNAFDRVRAYLKYCLHAEAVFIDKFLSAIESFDEQPKVIEICGNEDPCPQCQLNLSIFNDLISSLKPGWKDNGIDTEIRYISKKEFHGPCYLPGAMVESFLGDDKSSKYPYIPGEAISTRLKAIKRAGLISSSSSSNLSSERQSTELLQFVFTANEKVSVHVF